MIEYVNLAAVVWLAYYTLGNVYTVQISINTGQRITSVNGFPLALSIASLITLGIAVIKEIVT